MKDQTRRGFVQSGAATSGLLLTGSGLILPTAPAIAASTKDDAKIFSKYFKFEVKGISGNVPGVTSVDIGRLIITVEEATQGDKPEYRTYTYGSHEYDDMTFVVQQGNDPESKQLTKWLKDATQNGGGGSVLRRDCSLYYLARDKQTVLRVINLFQCYPVSVNEGDHDIGSNVKTMTVTLSVARIEEAKG